MSVPPDAPTRQVDVSRLRAALDLYESAYRENEAEPTPEREMFVEVALGVLQGIK